jgi:hypothetical protein
MNKFASLMAFLMAASGLLAAAPVAAQDRIYRCGNEYTNRIGNRKDCKVVEGGNVTVVRGTTPAAAPPAAGGSTGQRVVSAPAAAPRVDSPEQRAHAELLKEYNDGEPDKIGGEARNHQKYLDRVADLKASIARNQSDIDGIRREMARFK